MLLLSQRGILLPSIIRGIVLPLHLLRSLRLRSSILFSSSIVVKMDSQHEAVHFDKITVRLTKLSYSFNQKHCDPVLITQKVRVGLCKGVTTTQLDELAAETVSAMMTNHPGYGLYLLCLRIKEMYNDFNERAGQKAPFISDEVYEIIMAVSFLAYSILLFSAQFCNFIRTLCSCFHVYVNLFVVYASERASISSSPSHQCVRGHTRNC
ncbi:Ribonucleoside-diphosphate reductase large subunit [Platanthera guangdongensis]|uniref:Ribonucleoside-diphosphate reductase large subunit n=1 Tax=Platanthera guangdongensis TaxID=2320717 RepID=A0ABR2LWG1_9ASPA